MTARRVGAVRVTSSRTRSSNVYPVSATPAAPLPPTPSLRCMTTPDGFTPWMDDGRLNPPCWYADAEGLTLGLTRSTVAYDALVTAVDDNPEQPSTRHVKR